MIKAIRSDFIINPFLNEVIPLLNPKDTNQPPPMAVSNTFGTVK